MSAFRDAYKTIADQCPVIEFFLDGDLMQYDPCARSIRWVLRHPDEQWGQWRSDTTLRLIDEEVDQSTVRIVPRAEADDWRRRHQGAGQ